MFRLSCSRERRSTGYSSIRWRTRHHGVMCNPLFGTYQAQPAAGHAGMTIGIAQFRAPRELWLDRMLVQPFLEGAGTTAINHREARP